MSKHAEEHALEKYRCTLKRTDKKSVAKRKLHIYVIRINKNGELVDSKPCIHCVHTLEHYGIRKVTYSTNDNKLVTESLSTIKAYTSTGYKAINTFRI